MPQPNDSEEKALKQQILGVDGLARATLIETGHGSYHTPVFMPVGTKGTIKAMTSSAVQSDPLNCEILLGNTYHLSSNPTSKFLSSQNGLHNFMNYPGTILTDSGGFQMVSLLKLANITEEGVEFTSPVDSKKMLLKPEDSIQYQHEIDSDIIMVLDDVVHSCKSNFDRNEEATNRTIRWLDRCIQKHKRIKMKRKYSDSEIKRKRPNALFAITQGWLDTSKGGLRDQCLDAFLKKKREENIDGFAIGGLAGGEDKEKFIDVVRHGCNRLPREKPRYVMGVGYPVDLIVCICFGVDMFDCVYPTRTARFGTVFHKNGLVKIKQSQYFEDLGVIDKTCGCKTCNYGQGFSKAVLSFLLKNNPSTAASLLTQHNLFFLLDLMRRCRKAIIEKRFKIFVESFLKQYFEKSEIPSWVTNSLEPLGFTFEENS
eukprot:maker-scaffold_8-snap-gene-6.5-mRNA-1 protein AED:0.02 eAED:0.02 QI:0/0/0/1/1/1/3/0/427